MRKGFTLIELIMVIVILGILAVVAIPRYVNIEGQAEEAAEAGVVGAIRGGIHAAWAGSTASPKAFPATLGSASTGVCDDSNPCFGNVLQIEITDGSWTKTATGWDGPTGTSYTYNSATGEFE